MPIKKLPIGKEFFDSVIDDNYYYVDKTLLIRDILDKGAAFTLCTRPRRFGKTLSQTMLKCFFEDTTPIGGKDTRALFNGLKIESAGSEYMEHQGKYPVIFLSFKDTKGNTFETSRDMLKYLIVNEFKRHRYVRDTLKAKDDIELFDELVSGKADDLAHWHSLKFLCRCLEEYHNKKAIILIDEYDVPLENAWSRGFYDDMIDFTRPLLSNALKSNDHLQFAVATGCLRISKESIFTGLNNLDVISILNSRYNEFFGFAQDEVNTMLKYYNLENKTQAIKNWYDGYLFGNKEIYNSWSVINCVNDLLDDPGCDPKPYWANTSSNSIVRQLLENSNGNVRSNLETLMSGGVISKKIHEGVTYDEIDKHPDNLWNFLFFTGYLKKVGERRAGVQTILEFFDFSLVNIMKSKV